jgi:LysR family transcriptional regulator, benzoate and cis,cis-muconate-responsive activator of ben and cat genes
MEFRQIRYFLGVAEALNFSKAAINLNIVQPALSRQIQQLEDDLGVQLFERDKRNVRLTPAGVFFRDEMLLLVERFRDIRKRTLSIQDGHQGTIRIGYPGSALYSIVPEALCLLREKLPLVEGVLSEINEMSIVDLLHNNQIDACFSREGLFDHPLICTRELFSEPLALVVPESHQLTKHNFKSIAQCRDESFILPRMADLQQYKHQVYGIFGPENFVPRIGYESNYGTTIMRLVEKELGVSILPLSYRRGSMLKIRFIPLREHLTTLHLVWRSNDPSPVVRNFIDICKEAVHHLDLDFECKEC